MEALQRLGEGVHGYKHILDDLMLLVHTFNGLSLSQLEQRDLRRHHPPEDGTEDGVVPKWHDILKNIHNDVIIE